MAVAVAIASSYKDKQQILRMFRWRVDDESAVVRSNNGSMKLPARFYQIYVRKILTGIFDTIRIEVGVSTLSEVLKKVF